MHSFLDFNSGKQKIDADNPLCLFSNKPLPVAAMLSLGHDVSSLYGGMKFQ
jgi:hypothetical protein